MFTRVDIYLVSYCFRKNKLFKHCKVYASLFFQTSKIFYGQVHFSFLLVSGQVENFTISTPLNKMLVGIHKMLIRIANREDPDQIASSEAV